MCVSVSLCLSVSVSFSFSHTHSHAVYVNLRIENKEVKQILAKLVAEEGGYEKLKKSLEAIPQSASALAFLANVVKENSGACRFFLCNQMVFFSHHVALEAAERLYLEALELQAQSNTMVLSLIHLMEMRNHYNEAFLYVKRYVQSLHRAPLCHRVPCCCWLHATWA